MKANQSWLPAYRRPAISRRAFLSASAAGVGAVALIACGGGGTQTTLKLDDAGTARVPGTVWFSSNDWKLEDETKAAVKGGVYPGSESSENPGDYDAIAQMGTQKPFAYHVYERLMGKAVRPGLDPTSKDAVTPIGVLAESMEVSDDGLTVIFTMRPGVKFHNIAPVNGRVMDIEDWRTSHERHMAVGVYRSFLAEIMDKTEFPDARHMVWKLTSPYAPMFPRLYDEKFAYEIMPKELNVKPDLAKTVAIGTGFKVLDKHQRSVTIEYRKHPEYWGGEPYIDRWHFPTIPEYANRYAQFLRRSVISFAPMAREVIQFAKDAPEAIVVGSRFEPRFQRFLFGFEKFNSSPWADPRVRVAIRRSIDFKSISEFLANKVDFERAGIPIEMIPTTTLPYDPSYWLNPEKGELGALSENYLYNPAEAKKLTAAAGFPNPIPLYVPFDASSGSGLNQSNQLQMDSLKAAGTFDVTVDLITSRERHNEWRINRTFSGMVPSSTSNDPDYFLYRDMGSKYHNQPEGPFHAKTDALIDAQRRALVFEDRIKALKDTQLWLSEWMPLIPALHQYTSFSFRWPWLRNVNWGNGNTEGYLEWGAHKHWLDPEMRNRNG